jgi:hypothetical protein
VEGLRLSGRQLSREKLLQSLADLNDFDPGIGPRIAFGPSRRMGALGAYVVGIDFARKTFTAGEWLVPATEIVVDGNGIESKGPPRRDRLRDERASEQK